MTAEVKQSNSVGSPTFSLDRSARRPSLICKKEITQYHTSITSPALCSSHNFYTRNFDCQIFWEMVLVLLQTCIQIICVFVYCLDTYNTIYMKQTLHVARSWQEFIKYFNSACINP